MKIDKHLYSVLIQPALDNFTVSDVIARCARESNVNCQVKRNWAYYQLRRLTEKGMLEKKILLSPYRVIYRKTDLFDINLLVPKVNKEQLQHDLAPTSATGLQLIELMNERMKAIKVELLASISEGEEYKKLIQDFPSLSESLEERYQQCCLQSTKSLGRLRAIEAVIKEFQSCKD